MRDWKLTAKDPLTLRFAADCRLSQTDYSDDQSWELALGLGQDAALSAQTQYGGRAGLARIVPLWVFDDRAIFETVGYAEPFTLRQFAPNYAKLTAKITATLAVTFELWVMDSHAVGGRFTLTNETAQPISVRLDLVPQIVREGRMPALKLMRIAENQKVISLGALANLYPILLLERSEKSDEVQASTPKLGAPLTVPGNGNTAIRWVHAGYSSLEASVREGQKWLSADWDAAIQQIDALSSSIPQFETGDPELDALLAFKAQTVLRSYLNPTGNLPYPSPVAARIPMRGFGSRTGANHPSDWLGQTAQLLWLATPTTALIAPDLARGAIRNMLAIRGNDGWIDWKPGLGGQRSNMLAMPLLASTTWAIYEITEDAAFLTEVLPGLCAFFMRWFGADQDRDQDGVPEWSNLMHSGQEDHPIFNRFRRWSANAEISKAETPDLLALLSHEGAALLKIADVAGVPLPTTIQERIAALRTPLQTLWKPERAQFAYRDRDTHQTPPVQTLFRGKGDEWFSEGATLDPANRLLIRIIGGQSNVPQVTIRIEGVDGDGQPITETIPLSSFVWYFGMGTALSEHVFSRVNYLKVDGLSRVYQIEVETPDLSGHTLLNLLPLWAGAEPEQVTTLARQLGASWARPFGLPTSIADRFAVDHDNPTHQVTMLWNALLVDALLDHGLANEASVVIERLLAAEVRALRETHGFGSSYHAEDGHIVGNSPDDLNGIFPLHLVMKWMGVRVIDARRVWAGGAYTLARPIRVTQHGVTVTRSVNGTTVHFPTGYSKVVDGEFQVIEDPTAKRFPIAPPVPVPAPKPPPTPSVEPPSNPPTMPAAPTIPEVPAEPAIEVPPPTYRIKVRRVD